MAENRPERLYKYVMAARVDVLKGGMISFTPPSALNDPFEHAATLSGVYSAPPEPSRHAEGGKPGNMLAELFGAAFSTMISAAEQPLRHQGHGDKYAVLSLSERPDSLLMWSHYADEHRGFVIEFDASHAFFNRQQSDDDLFRCLKAVNYVPERPVLSLEEYSQALLYKSPHWEYEREWRMICPTDERSDKKQHDDRIIHLFAFPPESVSAVIIGAHMPDKDQRKIIDLVMNDPRYDHVALRFAREDVEHYALTLGGEGELHYRRALAAMDAEDEDGILENLNRAIEVEPDNAEYPFLRGAFVTALAVQAGASANDAGLADARADVERAVDLNPLSARYWKFLHELADLQGDSDRAVEALGRAVERDPKDAALRVDLARYRMGRGELDQALRDANRAVQLAPDDTEALFARAAAYSKLGDLDAAKADTDAVIALLPDNAMLYQARAQLHEQQGHADLAVDDLSRALELEPENTVALMSRARLNDAQGNLAAALADVDRYLALVPDDSKVAQLRSALAAAIEE